MMPTPAGHAPRPGVGLAAVGTGLAALAVVFWAVGMTVLQPLTEPLGPWSEKLPGDRSHWPRDLRFLALMAVASGLVLAGGGRRSRALPAVLLGGGAMAVDVAVDRIDLTGPGATVLLVVLGWLAVGVTVVLGVRRDTAAGPAAVAGPTGAAGGAGPYRAGGVVGRDRAVLTGVSCVTAVLAVVAVLAGAPTDREPELGPAALTTGLLLLASTVAGALAAAPARGQTRIAAAVGLAVAGVVGLWLVRLVGPGDRLMPAVVLGTVLVVGVMLLARPAAGQGPGRVASSRSARAERR
ncbi:hypothetical protein ACIG87_04895 [Micromonospora sp. NPDC051925]|uniref:hypothetical protein n=1 Tax=Micromonospora sp. NPDC051925 TaxID=3364288 RepID=UPI0037C65591